MESIFKLIPQGYHSFVKFFSLLEKIVFYSYWIHTFIVDSTTTYDTKGDTWDQGIWHSNVGSCFILVRSFMWQFFWYYCLYRAWVEGEVPMLEEEQVWELQKFLEAQGRSRSGMPAACCSSAQEPPNLRVFLQPGPSQLEESPSLTTQTHISLPTTSQAHLTLLAPHGQERSHSPSTLRC